MSEVKLLQYFSVVIEKKISKNSRAKRNQNAFIRKPLIVPQVTFYFVNGETSSKDLTDFPQANLAWYMRSKVRSLVSEFKAFF